MRTITLHIYRSLNFDGNIYAKLSGVKEADKYKITLMKDGKHLATLPGPVCVFENQESGNYNATASLYDHEDLLSQITSNNINVPPLALNKIGTPSLNLPVDYSISEKRCRLEGVDKYFLYIKLQQQEDIKKLKAEPLMLAAIKPHDITEEIFVTPPKNRLFGNILPATYRINLNGDYDQLTAIAVQLESLDYVIFCSVAPDMKNMLPPSSPEFDHATAEESIRDVGVSKEDKTPSYHHLQTYLQPNSSTLKGMNVLSVWGKGEQGSAATVRHLDFGVNHNHENLKGNISVVTNTPKPEPEEKDHGTATTGIIAASKQDFGITGIAHECEFHFYYVNDLDLIVRDAIPGDIVSLDVHLRVGADYFPVIHSRSWWDKIYALTQKGVVVIMAAGNGGADLSPEAGKMSQYGKSGGYLIGSCNNHDGRRYSSSNYNHQTSLLNSWGNMSIATTGYGYLNGPTSDENRKYTGSFGGTSGATPLVCGVLALIQSYAIAHYGIYLNSDEIVKLVAETGITDAVEDRIGSRPDVDAALRRLQEENETVSDYPQWDASKTYTKGDIVNWNGNHWLWDLNTEPKPAGVIYSGPWSKID